jgi:hypothetical protein
MVMEAMSAMATEDTKIASNGKAASVSSRALGGSQNHHSDCFVITSGFSFCCSPCMHPVVIASAVPQKHPIQTPS